MLGKIKLLLLFYSTELMRRVRRFQLAQYKCLVIKYAKDTRYSDIGMATHDKYVIRFLSVQFSCRIRCNASVKVFNTFLYCDFEIVVFFWLKPVNP